MRARSCFEVVAWLCLAGMSPAVAGDAPTPAERAAKVRDGLPEPSASAGFSIEMNLWYGTRRVGTASYSIVAEAFEGKPAWKATDVVDLVAPDSGERREIVARLDRQLRALALEITTTKTGADSLAGSRDQPAATTRKETVRFERGEKGLRIAGGKGAEADPEAIGSHAAIFHFLRHAPENLLECEIPSVDESGPSLLHVRMQPRGPWPDLGRASRRESWTPGERPFFADAWVASLDEQGAQSRRRWTFVLEGSERSPAALNDQAIAIRHGIGWKELVGLTLSPSDWLEATYQFSIGALEPDASLVQGVIHWPTAHARAVAAGFAGDEGSYRDGLLAKIEAMRKGLLPAESEGLLELMSNPRAPVLKGDAGTVHFALPARDYDIEVRRIEGRWWVVAVSEAMARGARPEGETWKDASRPEPIVEGKRLWYWARFLGALDRYDAYGQACFAISTMGADGAPTLARALAGLHAGDDMNRSSLVDALTKMGDAARPAVEEAMKSASPYARRYLETLLVEHRMRESPVRERTVPELIRELDDPDRDIRTEALSRLGGRGAASASAVPRVIEELRKPDGLREAAIHALGGIGAQASAAIPLLIEELKRPDGFREAASTALGSFGAASASAVPQLGEFAAVVEGPAVYSVVNALRGIGEPAIPALLALLSRKATDAAGPHEAAMHAHAYLARMGRASIPGLIERLSAPDLGARRLAAQALSQMAESGGEDAVPALRAVESQTDDTATKAAIRRAIRRLDITPPPVVRASPAEVAAYLGAWASAVGDDADPVTGFPRRIRRALDGAEMRLIPAGTFHMGEVPVDRQGGDEEKPRHLVTITKGYYLDVVETTQAQFEKFVGATGHQTTAERDGKGRILREAGVAPEEVVGASWRRPLDGGKSPADWATHPVVLVSWDDANAFAAWAGAALPTEAQFERAARGGVDGRKYPWGDDLPHPKGAGNFLGLEFVRAFPRFDVRPLAAGADDGFPLTAPVGTFAANPFGIHDLSGNVSEWCADWFDRRAYWDSAAKDPSGPPSGEQRVVRGGGWRSEDFFLRLSVRSPRKPLDRDGELGFRCARSLP